MVYQGCTTFAGQKLDSHVVSMKQVFDTVRKESSFDTELNQVHVTAEVMMMNNTVSALL